MDLDRTADSSRLGTDQVEDKTWDEVEANTDFVMDA